MATPERAVQVMFTSPYAALYLGVYGGKDKPVTGPDSLGALKVAATKGTTQEMTLTAIAPKASIVRFEDDTTSNTAFLSGQTDMHRVYIQREHRSVWVPYGAGDSEGTNFQTDRNGSDH